jgi:Uma2 family endonuclease
MTIIAAPIPKVLEAKVKIERLYSLETYFQREERALHKHEYCNGKIIKTPGGTFNHDNLGTKAATILTNFVENNDLNCFVNGSDTKIRIEDFNRVVYPDAVVICEKPIYYANRKDTIINPLVIVEVLSKSTDKYDEGDKFEYYRSLESFKEYVLINQKRKLVTVYTKQSDETWLMRDYKGDDATAILYALHNCPIPLKRLYRGLEI